MGALKPFYGLTASLLMASVVSISPVWAQATNTNDGLDGLDEPAPTYHSQASTQFTAPQQSQSGQFAGHGGQRQGGKRCNILQQLNLNAQQKSKLKSAVMAFKQENAGAITDLKSKREQMQNMDKGSRKAMHQQMKSERDALRAKEESMLKSVLTPDQFSQYQSLKEECKASFGGQSRHGGGGQTGFQQNGGFQNSHRGQWNQQGAPNPSMPDNENNE